LHCTCSPCRSRAAVPCLALGAPFCTSARIFLDDAAALASLLRLAADERGNTQTYALQALRSLATHSFGKEAIGAKEDYLIKFYRLATVDATSVAVQRSALEVLALLCDGPHRISAFIGEAAQEAADASQTAPCAFRRFASSSLFFALGAALDSDAPDSPVCFCLLCISFSRVPPAVQKHKQRILVYA
jgi:hypothetical protein